MTARRAFTLCLLLAAFACSDRDAPRPVPVPDQGAAGDTQPLSSRETPPGTAPSSAVSDPDDPAEPGISDLARLARYVFRTMQRHEEVCSLANPFRDRLHFALQIEVKGGRMARVALGRVGLEPPGAEEALTLARVRWPPELPAYVACLAPHLKAVTMAPAPVDGKYEPVYTFAGQPTGKPAP
jgi:hypothetical protein